MIIIYYTEERVILLIKEAKDEDIQNELKVFLWVENADYTAWKRVKKIWHQGDKVIPLVVLTKRESVSSFKII